MWRIQVNCQLENETQLYQFKICYNNIYFQNNSSLNYFFNLINVISTPELHCPRYPYQECNTSLWFSWRIVSSHVYSRCLLVLKFMIDKTYSYKYVDPKTNRTPNVFHVHISVGNGIPCIKHKTVQFWKVFNVTLIVHLSKKGFLKSNIFKMSCQASELRH